MWGIILSTLFLFQGGIFIENENPPEKITIPLKVGSKGCDVNPSKNKSKVPYVNKVATLEDYIQSDGKPLQVVLLPDGNTFADLNRDGVLNQGESKFLDHPYLEIPLKIGAKVHPFRISQEGRSDQFFQFSIYSCLEGQINGKKFWIFDNNMNMKWGEIKIDGFIMESNSQAFLLPYNDSLIIGKQTFTLNFLVDSLQLELTPIQTQTHEVALKLMIEKEQGPGHAIMAIKGKKSGISIQLSSDKKITVPEDTYVILSTGIFNQDKSLSISGYSSNENLIVINKEKTQIPIGLPAKLKGSFTQSGPFQYTFVAPTIIGASGETYSARLGGTIQASWQYSPSLELHFNDGTVKSLGSFKPG